MIVAMKRSLVNVEDYRNAARKILPKMLFDFVDGSALDGRTAARNSSAFEDWWFAARSFRSSSSPDLSWEAFGKRFNSPLILAPTGASGLLWKSGEQEASRAAADLGIVMEVSGGSLASMEDIAAAAPAGERWLQLFLYRDRELTLEFLERARVAGYTAICVTTDAPVHGRRENDERNGFSINQQLSAATLIDAAMHYKWWLRMAGSERFTMRNFASRVTGNMSDMASYIASVLDPDVTWEDFSWLRSNWHGPLVIKGVLNPDDAREAIARGVDAIQVSNHGGRQLDGTLASLDALPRVAEAVDGRVPVFLDGGISRGTDVLKAIALGATACVIGRSYLWGLAVQGRAGVRSVCELIVDEARNAMIIGGWPSLSSIDRSAVTILSTNQRTKQ